jgi:ribonuclease HI
MKIFRAYCESGFCHNTKRGTPSFILREDFDTLEKHSEHIEGTTSVRSEMMAVILALQHVDIYSKDDGDIVYIHTSLKMIPDAFNQNWISKWQAMGWVRKPYGKIENRDLWEQMIEFQKKYNIKFDHSPTNQISLMKKAKKLHRKFR